MEDKLEFTPYDIASVPITLETIVDSTFGVKVFVADTFTGLKPGGKVKPDYFYSVPATYYKLELLQVEPPFDMLFLPGSWFWTTCRMPAVPFHLADTWKLQLILAKFSQWDTDFGHKHKVYVNIITWNPVFQFRLLNPPEIEIIDQ